MIPVLSPIYAIRTGSKDGNPCFRKGSGYIEGCLTSELDNNPFGPLLFDNVQDILPGKGLKI